MTDTTPTVPPTWQALSPLKRDILLTLAVTGPETGQDINAALGRDPSVSAAISRRLSDLEAEGLVERSRAEGKRGNAKANALTDEGERLVRQVRA